MVVKELRAPKGSNKKKTIVGRGRSSGSGKTSGRGHNGQNSRSGGGVRLGFEGGQMPIYRRVAARGFSNYPFKKEYVVINLSTLEKLYLEGETVSLETLVEKGSIKKRERMVKILASGELKKKLTVLCPKFSERMKGDLKISASAKEKIEKVGGRVSEDTEEGK